MARVWKDVKGFEGLYQISDDGIVKSLCAGRWKTEMIRKPVPDKYGYLTVNLKKDGKYFCKKIHRLVAESFIENPSCYPAVNHKDENKENNRVNNLEWCDTKYNNNYGSHPRNYMKPIFKLSEDGSVIEAYSSVNEAAAKNNIKPSLISPVLTGKRKHAGGYRWAYQF